MNSDVDDADAASEADDAAARGHTAAWGQIQSSSYVKPLRLACRAVVGVSRRRWEDDAGRSALESA